MKNIKINFVAILLLIIGNLFLVFLLTYNQGDTSLNSTSIYSQSSTLAVFRNTFIDLFIQTFGIVTYIIPFIFLVWSFKLHKGSYIRFIRLRIVSIIYSLITLPAIIHINYSEYQSGVLGLFLATNISLFYKFNIILTIVSIFALLFASNINIHDIKNLIKLTFFTIVISYRLIKHMITKISNYIITNINRYKNQDPDESRENATSPAEVVAEEDNIPFTSSYYHHKEDSNNYHNPVDSKEESSIEEYQKNNEEETISPLHVPNYENKQKISQEETSIHNEMPPLIWENKLTPQNTPNPKIPTIEDIKYSEKPNPSETLQKKYKIPFSFLTKNQGNKEIDNTSHAKENVKKLEQIVAEFGVNGKIVNIQAGPVVTLYEMIIPAGVKTAKIVSLETDIALRMKAISVRIAVVPGKDVIGIEIPNQNRQIVYLRNILENKVFQNNNYNLPMVLGYDINGLPIVADLSTMPHLLIAGTTGSGKSVGVNAMILSLLYKFSPDDCKFIMIDPKMLELSVYQDIPHLLTPVVIDSKKAVAILKWVVKEMEYRYYQMSQIAVRNIIGFNEKIKDIEFITAKQQSIFDKEGINVKFDHMPYIVVIIDEMADLMLVAGKEVEIAVQRLAQMARAAGIHVIMATQRPSADVITGTIKANFPTRISFQVSSKIDSRVILGEQGAEKLLGKGDMLFMAGVGRLKRVHGPFISDSEVSEITEYLKTLATPNYIESIAGDAEISLSFEDKDELLDNAIEIIKNEGKVSTSFLQRKLQIGYNRAAKLVEQLEDQGLISKPQGAGKREIFIK